MPSHIGKAATLGDLGRHSTSHPSSTSVEYVSKQHPEVTLSRCGGGGEGAVELNCRPSTVLKDRALLAAQVLGTWHDLKLSPPH